MVKAATIGGRGGKIAQPGEEIDYGLPITHPALMIPIIGLIIMGSVFLITCFCKFLPEMVPDSLKFFGKRSADKDVQLQLGRRNRRTASDVSNLSQARPNDRRTPSFNSADRQGQNQRPIPQRIVEVDHHNGHRNGPNGLPQPPPSLYGWNLGINSQNNSNLNPYIKKAKNKKDLPYDCYLPPPPSYNDAMASVAPREELV